MLRRTSVALATFVCAAALVACGSSGGEGTKAASGTASDAPAAKSVGATTANKLPDGTKPLEPAGSEGIPIGPTVTNPPPAADRRVCPAPGTTPGWRYYPTSKQPQFKVVKEKTVIDNGQNSSTIKKTIKTTVKTTVKASLKASFGYEASGGVDLKAVSVGIKTKYGLTATGSYTLAKSTSETTTFSVPAHKRLWYAWGFAQMKVVGKYYRVDSCARVVERAPDVVSYFPIGKGTKYANY